MTATGALLEGDQRFQITLERLNPNSSVLLASPPHVDILDEGIWHGLAYESGAENKIMSCVAGVLTLVGVQKYSNAPDQYVPVVVGKVHGQNVFRREISGMRTDDGYANTPRLLPELRIKRAQRKAAKIVMTHLGVGRRDAKRISRTIN